VVAGRGVSGTRAAVAGSTSGFSGLPASAALPGMSPPVAAIRTGRLDVTWHAESSLIVPKTVRHAGNVFTLQVYPEPHAVSVTDARFVTRENPEYYLLGYNAV
jgi:hypothetical protein